MIHSRTPLAPWTATTGAADAFAYKVGSTPRAAVSAPYSLLRTKATTRVSVTSNRTWYPI